MPISMRTDEINCRRSIQTIGYSAAVKNREAFEAPICEKLPSSIKRGENAEKRCVKICYLMCLKNG